jgi:hypothetical protein
LNAWITVRKEHVLHRSSVASWCPSPARRSIEPSLERPADRFAAGNPLDAGRSCVTEHRQPTTDRPRPGPVAPAFSCGHRRAASVTSAALDLGTTSSHV